MSLGGSDFSRHRVRPSPGTIPEAEQLADLAFGLMEVRGRINRETAGAISPSRQHRAIDLLLQRSHDAIAATLRAADREHDRVLDAGDAFRLLVALTEHATFAYYWLQAGSHLNRVPPPNGQAQSKPLSAKQTALARQSVLTRIRSTTQFARDIAHDLEPMLPEGSAGTSSVRRLDSQAVCTRILAELLVWDLTERRPMPRTTVDAFLGEVDALRISSGFAIRAGIDKALILQTSAALNDRKGLHERAHALLEQRLAISRDDPDSHLHAVLEVLSGQQSAEDRLDLLRELEALATDEQIGLAFSEERIGRLSVIRDYLWGSALIAERDATLGGAATKLAFNCHSRWLYARDAAAPANPVWIYCAWSGDGRTSHRAGPEFCSATWSVSLELVERLHAAMERLAPSDCKPMRDVLKALDQNLGPGLLKAVSTTDQVRLLVGGPISRAPILATSAGHAPLGERANIAFAHPDPEVATAAPLHEPIDLLVLDESFSDRAAEVRTELEAASRRAGRELKVVAFNSQEPAPEATQVAVGRALSEAKSAVIFAHFDNPLEYAQWASMVLGAGDRLRTQEIMDLDLGRLQELTIVGCGSGRSNPFVGDATFAHAAASAGAVQVIYSLWPVSAKRGAEFVIGLSGALEARMSAAEYLASLYRANRAQAACFAILRP